MSLTGGSGTQSITTTGKNASGEGLLVKANGSGNAIINGSAIQTITLNNADHLRVAGQVGNGVVSANTGQTITLQGTGLNALDVGGATTTASSFVFSNATQSITAGQLGQAGAINVIGGSGDGTSPGIGATTGQTISTAGTLTIQGGTGPGPGGVIAFVRNSSSGVQSARK